jgi:hypothetical protein
MSLPSICLLYSCLGAIASAVLPSLASAAISSIRGKGLFIKSGSGIVKVKQLGDGLYLRPYHTEGITGDGLFIKRDGNVVRAICISKGKAHFLTPI